MDTLLPEQQNLKSGGVLFASAFILRGSASTWRAFALLLLLLGSFCGCFPGLVSTADAQEISRDSGSFEGEDAMAPIYQQARLLQRTRDERAAMQYGYGGGSWSFSSSGGRSKKGLRFGLMTGLRYFAHYNRQRVLSTPPETLAAEMQLLIWYKALVFYVTFAEGVAVSSSTLVGAGMRLPFLTFDGSGKGLISGISFQLVADFVHFSLADPVPPEDYTSSGFVLRYGATLNLGVNNSKFFAELTMMLLNLNSNFFIAPLFGVGFQF